MIKKILKILLAIILVLILIVGGYIIYLQVNYYRIEDNFELTIENNPTIEIDTANSYEIMTYNTGFGAYSQEYSFFMDKGVTNGKATKGKYSRAISKDDVIKNTNGQIETLSEYDPDFILLQEVDKKSTRSYKYNMVESFQNSFSNYGSIYASNFHSVYLPYPIPPHGSVESGIVTMSKYKANSSIRRQLPITSSFVSKFFDLDRCFSITRYQAGAKELVIINIHMSAYDEGGVYRTLQVNMLNEVLKEEATKGNYVIVGGDYNHDIANSKEAFPTKQDIPEIMTLTNENLISGYHFADAKNNAPTLRSADIPYEEGTNFLCVVDGFIVSDNIVIEQITNIDTKFLYSDHNPVYMRFSFK